MTHPGLAPATALHAMLRIRQLEEQTLTLSAAGEIAGSIHPCLGQEAIPVGAVAGLEDRDRVIATYRGHGWALARGSSMAQVLGEILHRAGGLNGGRAGSALLSDPSTGFLGENSIVGAGSPIAAGVGLAAQVLGSDRVVLVSLGDGAMNQGAAMEGMVFAAARSLPVVFLVENNGWSEMTATAAINRTDIAGRGTALGITSHVVDGCDPLAVAAAVADAATACRAGAGPVLLECTTVRLKGHYNRDIEHYRPDQDKRAAQDADPIPRMMAAALAAGLTEADLEQLERDVAAEVDAACAEALAMAPPGSATARDHLYGPAPTIAPRVSGKVAEMTYQRALNLALRAELDERPEVVVFGEDVGFAGGIFGVSRSLQKDYGDQRVFDTPIAEAAILGSAVGAAMVGLRPVAEIMWADFVFVALDQIVNQAANVRYINESRLSAPLTVRMQQGVTPGSCAQHSQSIEAVLAHVPGIKVGLPATPQDAYDMLRAAVADPDPTVVIEHRSLYQQSDHVDTGAPAQLAEGARFHREGSDLTIITWGQVLQHALAAADRLAADGIDAGVLDLRWLRPLDDEALARAVTAGGGRVLVVHEAFTFGGFGAEVAARITSDHFPALRSPVARLGTDAVRLPAAPALQDAVVPSTDHIVVAARDLASVARV